MLSLYEILKASKTGIAPDMWTALAGMNWSGADSGHEVKELTGIPPLSFTADGTPLLDYLISGNMSQTGTPTPTTPIQPQETGERTGNLFDKSTWDNVTATRGTVDVVANGIRLTATANDAYTQTYGNAKYSYPVTAGETYTLSWDIDNPNVYGIVYLFSGSTTGDTVLSTAIASAKKATFTIPNGHQYLSFRLGVSSSGDTLTYTNLMLNLGSEALPYEPYGFKIPISSGGNNLFDLSKYTGYSTGISDIVIDENGITYTAASPLLAIRYSFPLTENDSYVVSLGKESTSRLELRYFKDNAQVGNTIVVTSGNNVRITGGIQYDSIRIYISNGSSTGVIVASNIMLNRGSTALPYEPYVPPTLSNIYLGEAQTTRQIKKLVLDGTEQWQFFSDSTGAYGAWQFYVNDVVNGLPMSSAWSNISDYGVTAMTRSNYLYGVYLVTNGTGVAFQMAGAKDTFTNISSWKSYLQQQYQNGTPVTVWYVLATPKTAVVNEPLRKIGDYADTVSYEQAGVQIPTVEGNTVIDVETTLKPSEVYIKYQE